MSSEITSLQAVFAFSHLRWNFVFQRPQHLLTRLTRQVPVYYWEEPVFEAQSEADLLIVHGDDKVTVITPRLPHGMSAADIEGTQRRLLDQYLSGRAITRFVSWYYTPMALGFTDHLTPEAVVYDCMDELSAFQGAPPELLQREQELFAKADVVFAGGASLYESKKVSTRMCTCFQAASTANISRRHANQRGTQ